METTDRAREIQPPNRIGEPPPKDFLALAPLRLINHRRLRYVGDDLCIRIEELTEGDQKLLRALYQRLTDLLYTIANTQNSDARKWDEVQAWIDWHVLEKVINEARDLGRESQQQDPGENMAKAMHDLRGGALFSLLGHLQLIGYVRSTPEGLNVLFVLTRDHLKIMRNAVVGLDEPRREADRKPKTHAMQLMLDKWHESIVRIPSQERRVRMEIDCRYEGPLTECCLESAAIDRIFYNLAANASRYTADERLKMVVFPIPEPPGDCLRFVLSNEVDESVARKLRDIEQHTDADSADLGTGESLFALFQPDPSGLGLTVAADFVAEAFGLRDRRQALHERYIGAILEERTLRVWFHWPMASRSLPSKLDDYRRPSESLSEA